MSDERLRELERAVAAGDPSAAERLLRERLRMVSLGRLQLAAFLGDEPTTTLLRDTNQPWPEPIAVRSSDQLSAWVERFTSEFDAPAIERAARVGAGGGATCFGYGYPDDGRLSAALAALDDLIVSDGAERDRLLDTLPAIRAEAEAAQVMAKEAEDFQEDLDPWYAMDGGLEAAAANGAEAVVRALGLAQGEGSLGGVLTSAVWAWGSLPHGRVMGPRPDYHADARAQIVRSVAGGLIPWALGERDPVADRIAKRGRSSAP